MGSRSKAARAGSGVFAAGQAARDNAYVQRLIEDEELRESLREAFGAARNAYGRVSHGKRPARMLMDDKRVHRDVTAAAGSLRDAADALRGGKQKRRGGLLKRVLVVGVVGAGVALVASEGMRKKVLDGLFGAEEEFEYTSTTSPPATAASNGGSAASTPEPAAEKS